MMTLPQLEELERLRQDAAHYSWDLKRYKDELTLAAPDLLAAAKNWVEFENEKDPEAWYTKKMRYAEAKVAALEKENARLQKAFEGAHETTQQLVTRCHRLEESIRTTHTCTDHYCRACEYEIEKRHAEEELGGAK